MSKFSWIVGWFWNDSSNPIIGPSWYHPKHPKHPKHPRHPNSNMFKPHIHPSITPLATAWSHPKRKIGFRRPHKHPTWGCTWNYLYGRSDRIMTFKPPSLGNIMGPLSLLKSIHHQQLTTSGGTVPPGVGLLFKLHPSQLHSSHARLPAAPTWQARHHAPHGETGRWDVRAMFNSGSGKSVCETRRKNKMDLEWFRSLVSAHVFGIHAGLNLFSHIWIQNDPNMCQNSLPKWWRSGKGAE